MEMSLQDRIQEIISAGFTPSELARAAGKTAASVTFWLNGQTKSIKGDSAAGIEKLTGYSAAWVATGKGQKMAASNVEPAPALRTFRQIPVVGEVKGGDHGYLDELQYPVGHGEGTVDFPTADPMAYALRVRGDSMHPRYRAGEFVVVEPSVEALPGDDVVVALVDGRKLLKELGWWRDGELQLLSVNNHFGPMTLESKWIASIHLVAGRVRRGAINK